MPSSRARPRERRPRAPGVTNDEKATEMNVAVMKTKVEQALSDQFERVAAKLPGGAAVEFLEFGEVRPGRFFEEDGELAVHDPKSDVEIVRDATVDDDGVERVIEDLGFGIAPMEIREEGGPFPFAGGDDLRFGIPRGEELELCGMGGDLADQAGGVGVPS